MSKVKYTYNLSRFTIGFLLWEAFFWILFYIFLNSLHLFNSGTDSLVFTNQGALYWLVVIIPMACLFFFHAFRYNKMLSENKPRLQSLIFKPVSSLNLFLRYFFLRNAFAFLIIAMASPAYGTKKAGGTIESMELVVCLDISQSMNTIDLKNNVSRLEASKRAIVQLINNLHGEKVGLCLFANSAFVQLPLTNDYATAKIFVEDISTNMISDQGTNIKEAMSTSLEMFSEEETAKGILLITDGENHEANPDKILSNIKNENIGLNVLGIGSKNGGLIPNDPNRKNLGYKKDAVGRSIVSKVNPSFIKDIASKAGGSYELSESDFPDMRPMLKEINTMKRTKVTGLEFDVKQQRFQIPLLIGFLFWISYTFWYKKIKDE